MQTPMQSLLVRLSDHGDVAVGARCHVAMSARCYQRLAEAIASGDGQAAAEASDALQDALRDFAQEVIA